MHAILEAVFPSRIKAVLALLAPIGPDAARNLSIAADEVRASFARVHDEAGQADWQGLAEVLDISSKLRLWHQAVRDGEADAERFLKAARLQRSEWLTADAGYGHELKSKLAVIDGEFSARDVSAVLDSLARVPFPIGIFTEEERETPRWQPDETKAKPELAVAFLEFRINGKEAAAIHRLAANTLHDLELILRVSRWPEEAARLLLKPVSVEPEDLWELPQFTFERPDGGAPFMLEAHGRLAIRMPMALGARPLEFLYAAEFAPVSAEQPIAVAGHRSLRLDSSDASDHLVTGYPSLDHKMIELRDALRAEPRVPERETGVALRLAKPLANLVGQAIQDNIFPKPIDEATLEKRVTEHLRRHPEIGVELEVQAHSGGGRTDLSLQQVRVELKVKNDSPLTQEDLNRFAFQAAAYAVSSDKTIAILCVLDGSAKNGLPIPMPEAVRVIPVQPADRPIYVIAFILQGNLARPSDLSR
ncbi:MAG: hypothetical protein E5V89_11025 [Mesorhizobium sp.]|nr:MAG: hypothetical protein E5V89_11025 [Mesorhizobium sp.]